MAGQEIDHLNNTLSSTPEPQQPSTSYTLLVRLMSKRRTWVFLFITVYTILLSSSWNLLKSILSWYNSSSSSSGWPAIYASVLLGAVFGVISMVAALVVALPAMLITWITILVLLTFFGKSKSDLVVEGRIITGEITSCVVKTLLKEGNLVAALCAVLGYFALVRSSSEADLV